MSFSQTQIQPTNFDQFPFAPGSKLGAVALNDAFLFLQNQVTNLQNQVAALQRGTEESNLGISITTDWGGNTSPTAGTYVLTPTAPYEFTIVNMDVSVGNSGGSFDLVVLNNGSPIPGLSVHVTDANKINFVAISNNVVLKGVELDVVISNISGVPTNTYIALNGSTNAISEPLVGVGVGFAQGSDFAIGMSTFTLTNGALASTTGTALVGAFGFAALKSVGIVMGNASVVATGTGIFAGGRVATATGGSTAQAVGDSQTGPNTLALDQGALDINPLG